VRALQADGSARAQPTRVAEHCLGGIALSAAAHELLLGCVRPDEDEERSEVVLYVLDHALHTLETRALGRAGRDGLGIAVAHEPGGSAALYLDGEVNVHALRLVRFHAGKSDEHIVSRPGHDAADPSLLVAGSTLLATWSETEYDSLGASRTELMLAKNGGEARVLARTSVHHPLPSLSLDAGGLVLSFRDQPGKERRAEHYVQRLRADLVPSEHPIKVGRSNSEGAPSLQVCGDERVALLPREYAGERYIGVHPLDEELHNLTGGHQFYANSRDFVRAAGVCSQGHALFMTAERKTPAERGVHAVTMSFTCD
jgi:hypothetical protein